MELVYLRAKQAWWWLTRAVMWGVICILTVYLVGTLTMLVGMLTDRLIG